MEVTDYNYTSISVCVKSKFTKINVPLEIYREIEINETNKLKETKYKNTIWMPNIVKRCYTIDTDESLLGQKVKFGEESTEITLNESNNGILADLWMRSAQTSRTASIIDVGEHFSSDNYRGYWKFNITLIPDTSTIVNSTLYIYILETSSVVSGENTVFHHVYGNTSWNYGTMDWQDQPCDDNFNNASACNLTYLFNELIDDSDKGTWIDINLTTAFTHDHNNNYDYSFLAGKTITESRGNPNWIDIRSLDYADISKRPYIKVWYDESAQPSVTSILTSPANNSVNTTGNVYHTAAHTAENSILTNASIYTNVTGSWVLNQTDLISGTSNTSNFTLSNIPNNAYYIWNVYACNNETNCSWSSANWTVNITFPDTTPPSIVSSLENISNDWNWIYVNWSDPVDADLDEILIRRNGTNIANVSSGVEVYNLTGLDSATWYNITLFTVDTTGNINNTIKSNNSILSKTLTGDVTPPVITISLPVNNTNLSYNTTSSILTITTDEPAECRYETSNANFSDMIIFSSTDSTTHTNTTSVSYGNTYSFYYRCNDTQGNNNTVSEYHFFGVNDTTAPNVTLVSPSDGFDFTVDDITVTYLPIDDYQLENCYLYTNISGSWSLRSTHTSPTNGSNNNFQLFNLNNGKYKWNVNCTDDVGQSSWASSNRTFSISVPTPNITTIRWRANGSDVFTYDENGDFSFPLGEGTMLNLTLDYLWVLIDAVLPDLTLLGESDSEFAVGAVYKTITHTRTGCASIIKSGTYAGSEDADYYIIMDTQGGAEIGVARFNYSDDGTTDWDGVNIYTSRSPISLNSGVVISFIGCDGADFAQDDVFEFDAIADPTKVFRIDTNQTDFIESSAIWNYTEGNISVESELISNELCLNVSNADCIDEWADITQNVSSFGEGAILIGDSAGDIGGNSSDFYWNDTSNRIAIGGQSNLLSVVGLNFFSKQAVHCESDTELCPLLGFLYTNTQDFSTNIMGARSRGTMATPTASQDNDDIMAIVGLAHDGTDYGYAVQILMEVDGTVSNNNTPGRIKIQTTPNGSHTALDRLIIDSTGKSNFTGNNLTNINSLHNGSDYFTLSELNVTIPDTTIDNCSTLNICNDILYRNNDSWLNESGDLATGDLTMNGSNKVEFWDGSQYIYAAGDNQMTLASGLALYFFLAGSQAASLSTSIFTIGGEGAGVDYQLQFKGESNLGFIQWMEDEDYLLIKDDMKMDSDENINMSGNNITDIGYSCYTANCSSYTYHNGTHLITKG